MRSYDYKLKLINEDFVNEILLISFLPETLVVGKLGNHYGHDQIKNEWLRRIFVDNIIYST
jgi:hypothetical protein